MRNLKNKAINKIQKEIETREKLIEGYVKIIGRTKQGRELIKNTQEDLKTWKYIKFYLLKIPD